MSPSLKIDEVKDFLWVALRSQERFSQNLKDVVEGLDKIREGEDEWLLSVQEEFEKGIAFCDTQHGLWQAFGSRVEDYIATVRKEADDLAIQGDYGNRAIRIEDIPHGRSHAWRSHVVVLNAWRGLDYAFQ